MQTLTRQFRVFIIAVIASAVIGVLAASEQIESGEWSRLVLFFAVIVAAYSLRVPDPRGWSATPTVVLSYLAIYVLSCTTALAVLGIGRTVGYVVSRGWVPWRATFNGAQIALSVAAGSLVFSLLGGEPGRVAQAPVYAAFIAGPLVHHAANNLFVAYGISRVRRAPFLSTWLSGIRDLFWPNLLSIPTAIILAILYVRVHHVSVLAYLALLPLQWMALRLYIHRRRLYAQVIDGLVIATDISHPLGRGHAHRVAELSMAIAREMHLSEAAVESVQFAALLHDVGMIGKDEMTHVPMSVSEVPKDIRDHVRVGAEIAREMPRKDIAELILRHHERFDGRGYPGGLRSEGIPLGARIIALAEAVDGMLSGVFPQSRGASTSETVALVVAEREKAFDPKVVDAWLRVVEKGPIVLENMEVSSLPLETALTPRGAVAK